MTYQGTLEHWQSPAFASPTVLPAVSYEVNLMDRARELEGRAIEHPVSDVGPQIQTRRWIDSAPPFCLNVNRYHAKVARGGMLGRDTRRWCRSCEKTQETPSQDVGKIYAADLVGNFKSSLGHGRGDWELCSSRFGDSSAQALIDIADSHGLGWNPTSTSEGGSSDGCLIPTNSVTTSHSKASVERVWM